MKRKKKNKILSFSNSMEPVVKEKERSKISSKPLSKTKKKITRFNLPKMS